MPTWLLRWLPTAILVAIIAAVGAYGVHFFREQGRNEYRPQVQALKAELAAEKADRARAEKATASYRAELDSVRSRPITRVPVRLCSSPLPSTVTTARSADDATSRTGSNHRPSGSDLEAGPDIGPELYNLAQVCDIEIARLRALQGWINDVR